MSTIADVEALARAQPRAAPATASRCRAVHAPAARSAGAGSGGWWRCRRRRGRACRRARAARRRSCAASRRQLGRRRAHREAEGRAAARAALSTRIVPPISSASRLQIARPEAGAAVLARGRAVGLAEALEQPADARRRDSRCRCRATANSSSRLAAVERRRRCTVSTTSPRSVNLTALASRFSSTWRSRVTSPTIAAGTSPSNDVGEVEVLLGRARAPTGRAPPRRTRAGRTAAPRGPAAGLDLREVEDVVDDRQQRVAGVADGRPRSRAARR